MIESLRKLRAQFDWPLAVGMLLIISLGLLNLYSAAMTAPKGLFQQQLLFYGGGTFAFLLVAAVDYRVYERLAVFVYPMCLSLLAFVLVSARSIKGSHRWIGIGAFSLQPSELAKIGTILLIAKLTAIEPQEMRARGLPYFLSLLGVLLLPCGLIYLQPDLGTAMLLFLVGGSMLLMSSARWPTKLQSMGLMGLFIAVRLAFGLKEYQKKRLMTFIDPTSDPSGAAYHSLQSMYAIGSGRFIGKGYRHGTQNQFHFLPEHWTDFPFAVWSEEWGLVGGIVLLVCYLFLILWALGVSSTARDRFGQMLAFGVASLLFWHTVINIGMVTGALPVVGVTLPLFSYGGSSLLTTMIALGLLMNVSIRKFSY